MASMNGTTIIALTMKAIPIEGFEEKRKRIINGGTAPQS